MDNDTKTILSFFEELTKIPRPTRGEEAVANYILGWAKSNNLEAGKDETGNVIIRAKATKGRENDPIVTIQGHMDMVCEKTAESTIDPSTQPLKLIYDGDWLSADGTTLGADNGIGLAYAMHAATNDSISHPELELLFTIAEEDGFDGVHGLKPNTLKGKYLINLDSSAYGVFTVASASTQNTGATLKLSKTNLDSNLKYLEIVADNMMGGHSGIDIAKMRANASIALFYSLKDAFPKAKFNLVSFDGGTRRNVIPRRATAIIAVEAGSVDIIKESIKESEKYVANKYTEETNPTITVTETSAIKDGLSIEDTKKAIDFITALPNGLESWSKDLENTIEASNNIAIVKLEDAGLTFLSLQRGATMEGLNRITGKLVKACTDFNIDEKDIDVQQNISTPWAPNPSSPLLAKSQKVFESLFGKKAAVYATHGGLECACIGEKHPEMDMISFGPSIEDLHSPDERLFIPSLEPTWKLLAGILAEI